MSGEVEKVGLVGGLEGLSEGTHALAAASPSVQQQKGRAIGGAMNLNIEVVVRHEERGWAKEDSDERNAGNHLYTAAFHPTTEAPLFWLRARFFSRALCRHGVSADTLTGVRGLPISRVGLQVENCDPHLGGCRYGRLYEVVYEESGLVLKMRAVVAPSSVVIPSCSAVFAWCRRALVLPMMAVAFRRKGPFVSG